MRTRRKLTVAVTTAVLVAGCSGGDATDPASSGGEGTDAVDSTEELEGESDDNAASDEQVEESSGEATASGGASVQLGDQTYEAPVVLDCTVDDPMAPDDRMFVGENADGTVRISISYFEDAALSGLTGLDVEIEGPDGDATWSSTYVGADREFTIDQRVDGADGTAEISRLEPGDEPRDLVAAWSFTC